MTVAWWASGCNNLDDGYSDGDSSTGSCGSENHDEETGMARDRSAGDQAAVMVRVVAVLSVAAVGSQRRV